VGGGAEGEREKKSQADALLSAEPNGAQSHDPETMT